MVLVQMATEKQQHIGLKWRVWK